MVLDQSAVARLPVSKQIFDHVERVLDLGADARLDLLVFLRHLAQRAIAELLAFVRLHHDVLLRALGLFALVHATVAGIAKRMSFVAVKQFARLGHIIDVRRTDKKGVG